MFQLTFLGANATVTGSRYLLETGRSRVLVDCGLFQGYKPLRLRNWAPFPVAPESIDAIVLTHAHLDHSGYIPRLVRSGFRGSVWCTPATRSLCRILLADSGRLLEEEAEYANRKGTSKHHPALPLYSEADAIACLKRFRTVDFDESFEPVPDMRVRFRRQGHILGAAAVTAEAEGRRIVFSGDVGRYGDPLMPPPTAPDDADWIVVESTYGNRRHPAVDAGGELASALRPVLERGGVAIVPAFAVGRAQLLLHLLTQLQAERRIPDVPIYLNSPMATDVSALYADYPDGHRLTRTQLDAMARNTRVVNSVEESKALNRRKGPMVIVSASGMATGGRVLHHLVAFAGDPRNAILLSGFQAGGTRGARLVAGDKTIRIFGQDIAVKADVIQLESASAHADADELVHWLRSARRTPETVFITHGEPEAAEALRTRVERELHWHAQAPEYRDTVDLAATGMSAVA
ncbi:MBL fold metallo-hydrolase [Lysobacter arvi]|nr:MBL fold metallo-hydrolase [Lysobacter arvi]